MPGSLLELWLEDDNFIKIMAGITAGPDYRAAVTGLDGSARTFFIAALARQCRRPALVVTRDAARAEKVYSELAGFFPDQVGLLPEREFLLNAEVITRSEENQQMRMQFLEWLGGGSEGLYAAPVSALFSKMIPVPVWNDLTLHLRPGRQLDRQELIARLVESGYERNPLTETRGRFSARGDIIDIYPPGFRLPVRLELFDDTVQSLRLYDPLTQRSTGSLSEVAVRPARELVITAKEFKGGEKSIRRSMERALSRLRRRGEMEAAAKLRQEVNRHLEKLAQPDGLDYLAGYFPFFYEQGASLLDYLPPGLLLFIEEPATLVEAGSAFRSELDHHLSGSPVEKEMLGSGNRLAWTEEELFANPPCSLVSCALFPGTGGLFKARETYSLESKSAPYYHGRWELFQDDYRDWLREGYRVYLVSSSEQRGRNLLEQLSDQGVFDPEARPEQAAGIVTNGGGLPLPPVFEGGLQEGLVIPGLRLALVGEQNLLPQRKKKKRLRPHDGIRLTDYRDLSAGDYVVHEQHGIGRYQGLSTLEIRGVKRDYLCLKYRGTDRLYIPVDQIGLVQKYSGGEGPAPRLHSLGGGEWQRLKKRVNRSVEELAQELLALYAARQTVDGYSFGPDHPWQQEFEMHFPYEETPDQVRAINEVKADLEKGHPMDRLVCGDVGYGKTEVAMRAAFKVVMEGKQAAVLVPTTVLAQQHYRTFRERFEHFPVKVAQLSRFVSRADQQAVLKGIAAGRVDIVIGTHRLLSGDVRFNDLGLLVLDEEQRFGVRQKEKIKKMRLEVDTLAMSATPIPRTLHLSLAGARDLSVIDSPPEDRYPVQTYVLEYSEDLVREAVRRELKRGGQVFIVFNRVDQIESFAEKIRGLFPAATIAVGHGRMPESALENVMVDFQNGSYQILVCTTIIEAGLDIPNVNTLIVYEADKFGLAQLYQIRGRVGRSNRLAYAYLTYRREKTVSPIAQKRLKAVKEFTELGSGFKIALRDLEIRGAGNILGAEQHGFITAVGFDLYSKLLERAVAELKNEQPKQTVNPRLELLVNAYLPASYISAQAQKVDFYQRIYDAASREELGEIEEELADRYGSPGEPVKNLLAAARLRILAAGLGIELIRQQHKGALVQFSRRSLLDANVLQSAPPFTAGRVEIKTERPLKLKFTAPPDPALDCSGKLLNNLVLFVEELAALNFKAGGGWISS